MKRWLPITAAALVCLSVIEASYYLHVCQDDSFISFRYAANLAEHGSLAFNGPGYERAEGYSNFTWVLLLAVLYAVGLAPLACAKAMGILSLVAALLGTMKLVDQLLGRESPWRLFAVAALGSSACFVVWSVQGLETVFVSALVTWSALSVVRVVTEPDDSELRRQATRAGLLLGVLGISRPETALFGVVGIAGTLLTLRTSAWRPVASRMIPWFAVPVLAQLVFRIAYYGRVTANTYYAKVLGDDLIERGFTYLFSYAEAKGVPFAVASASIVIGAFVRATRKNSRTVRGPAMIAALLVTYAGYIVWVGGDWMRGFRFCMHVLPLGVALGTWGLASLVDGLPERITVPVRAFLTTAAVLIVLHSNLVSERNFKFGAQGAVADTASGLGFFSLWSVPSGPHAAVARWLRHRLPKTALVATSEAGIIPFESELPVLDDVGLNDRTVADMMHSKMSHASVATYVLHQTPSAIVMLGRTSPETISAPFKAWLWIDLALFDDPAFRENYTLSAFVPLEASRGDDSPLFGFGVFTRKGVSIATLQRSLFATPNPVPTDGPVLGVTTISWKGWDGENAQLFVSDGGGPEMLFAAGDQGAEEFRWVQVGHSYVFHLYGRAHSLRATLKVTRR